MTYFKIGDVDISNIVNELKVNKSANYSAQTNALGNTVVDYINSKREIEVGIIPLTEDDMSTLLNSIDGFNVSISFLNPITKQLEDNVNCIIPSSNVEYYTIQVGKVMYKTLTLTFVEL